MLRILTVPALLSSAWWILCGTAAAAQVTAQKTEQGVAIAIDGVLFTEYLIQSGAKPVLWPLIGPTGKHMTRAYPMQPGKVAGERQDHVHHRSLWLTHGDVNGVDFWGENRGHGTIVHREFTKVEGGNDVATVVARNDWQSPDGERLCEDVRELRFGGDMDRRWIDFDCTIRATDRPVTFGDTKEGTFGIRVAGSMEVDAGHGKIVNSGGETDKQAWGKPASWVDYHGPVDGQHVGIAVLNHPTSFRFPTCWHVRTYGLFAANPFGLHEFLNRSSTEGAHTLQPGTSIVLRYRVVLHKGDEKTGRIAEEFAAYAQTRPGED